MPGFSLLSLNTFGLPFFLGWTRLRRLAQELTGLDTTALCLQEIQQNNYVPMLRRQLLQYPYCAFESNRLTPKGGLMTVSQLPLHASHFIAFKNRGHWRSVGFGDWALNKGVLCSRLELQGGPAILLNTHLHANYAGDWRPENAMAQIQRDQVLHLAEIIHRQPAEALVIVCGDFNFPRGTFLYEAFLQHSGLHDPLATDPRPTYRPFPLVPAKWNTSLDFVFVRPPDWEAFAVHADILPIEDFTARWPHQRFLSDHNALHLNVTWK